MSEWRPIESAPRDGTWILVWGEAARDSAAPPIAVARWAEQIVEEWEQTGPKTKTLVVHDWSSWEAEGDIYDPTHWMPLPSPPHIVSEEE